MAVCLYVLVTHLQWHKLKGLIKDTYNKNEGNVVKNLF